MKEKEPSASSVFQVPGEPAICINGLPEIPTGALSPCSVDDDDLEAGFHGPFFGRWLQGRRVSKLFGDKLYSGTVIDFDQEMKWYRVVYEDGDFEDLDQEELDEVLLPVDVSVPLEALCIRVDQLVGTGRSMEVSFNQKSQSPFAVRASARGRANSGASSGKSQRRMSTRASNSQRRRKER